MRYNQFLLRVTAILLLVSHDIFSPYAINMRGQLKRGCGGKK